MLTGCKLVIYFYCNGDHGLVIVCYMYQGDAAAASMLGQPQQSAPLQLDEPTTDATAPAAEDTFFSTQPFPQPRPFNEIVSSVTGTFDFLQDSQIEQGELGL